MSDLWYQDPTTLWSQIDLHGSQRKAAQANNVNPSTVNKFAKRYPRDASSAPTTENTPTAGASKTITEDDLPWTRDDVTARALPEDDDEFVLVSVKPGVHQGLAPEGRVVDMYRAEYRFERRLDSLIGIQLPSGWKPPKPRPSVASTDKPIHIPLFGDPHFPMHEPALYDASLAWLKKFKPPRWICMGDEGDWSPFKRHKPNRRTDTTVAEAVIGTFEGLAGWAAFAPGDLIDGNHTRWLSSRIAENMPSLMGLKRPGDEHEMHSLNHILKLPELGITYHEAGGEWFDSQLKLTDDLVLLHGVKTGKHGGAIKEHDGWEGVSVAQGHDHSLQMTAVSKKTATGYSQHYAISTGAMSLRDLGYSSTKEVDQGFAVITIWPDGRWHPDFALFNPQTGETTWRDWRYRPE